MAISASLQAEIARRNAPIEGMFPAQRAAATDKERFKAICTPRRAGKTNTILGRFLELGMKYPLSRMPYVMLTRGQCKDVAWPEIKVLDQRYNVGLRFNETELYCTFPNKSQINFYGADKPGWMSRMRGQKNRAVAVDEAQDFTIDLDHMIKVVLRPTLIDLQGEFWLAGTPSHIRQGAYFEVTTKTGKIPGWKVFNWSAVDNPHVSEQIQLEIEQIKADYAGEDILQLPWVQREYFGLWAQDDEDSVYHFDPSKNAVRTWEPMEGDEYVCGIDLGWHDATAFVVGVFNAEERPEFIVLESHRFPKMLLDDAAKMVREFEDQYPGIVFVADPARRQLLEDLQVRADVYIMPADKAEKKDHIELVNRDLVAGRIKLLKPEENPLAKEMTDLKWLKRPSGKVIEHPKFPNDCADAFLYAWRRGYHYLWEPKEDKPMPGTLEYYEMEARQMREAAARRIRDANRANQAWWERS